MVVMAGILVVFAGFSMLGEVSPGGVFILAMPIPLLVFAAASMTLKSAATYQPGTHGLSEVLYNFAWAANNKGRRSPTREPAHSGTRSRRASPC